MRICRFAVFGLTALVIGLGAMASVFVLPLGAVLLFAVVGAGVAAALYPQATQGADRLEVRRARTPAADDDISERDSSEFVERLVRPLVAEWSDERLCDAWPRSPAGLRCDGVASGGVGPGAAGVARRAAGPAPGRGRPLDAHRRARR